MAIPPWVEPRGGELIPRAGDGPSASLGQGPSASSGQGWQSPHLLKGVLFDDINDATRSAMAGPAGDLVLERSFDGSTEPADVCAC